VTVENHDGSNAADAMMVGSIQHVLVISNMPGWSLQTQTTSGTGL
jgi:hypothetical protein